MRHLHLVSYDICPYVQRAMILLHEKNVSFDLTSIDLQNKPDWFLKISPLGKVPLLLVDDVPLFESNVICEYLDETQGLPLHPQDALKKAYCRSWMEYASVLQEMAFRMGKVSKEEFDRLRKDLDQHLSHLEKAIASAPYFLGENFSMVDAFYGPFFRFFEIYEEAGENTFFMHRPRLESWRQTLRARPSIQRAVPQNYARTLKLHLMAAGGHIGERLRRLE